MCKKKKTLRKYLKLSFWVGCLDEHLLCPDGSGSRVMFASVSKRLQMGYSVSSFLGTCLDGSNLCTDGLGRRLHLSTCVRTSLSRNCWKRVFNSFLPNFSPLK